MITNDFISKHWPLSNIHDVQLLKKSGKRMVYKVCADEGIYIVKVADSSKDEGMIMKDTDILKFFEMSSYPAPRLLSVSDGRQFVTTDEGVVYAISFIDGREPEKNVEDYRLLGEVTARLHMLQGYKTETDFTTSAEIPRMLKRAQKFNVDARYEQLARTLPDFSQLPKCLIHTDIGSHNSIKTSNGEIILIDWDDAGIGTRILDIGFPLICDFMTKDLVFEKQRAIAFYEAYASKIQLTDSEKAHIFDAGLFYALSYTIFDDSGFVEGQWQKVLAAIEQKNSILSVLPT